jgi:hypothetical protein
MIRRPLRAEAATEAPPAVHSRRHGREAHAEDRRDVRRRLELSGGPPDDLARKVEVLHGHCATVGRNPSEITVSCHLFVSDSPQETAERAAAYAAAGAEHLVLYFTDNSNVRALGPTVEAVAAATT